MNRLLESPPDAADEIDLTGVALVGVLFGVIFVAAGWLGQHPVLRAMAETYHEKGSLSAGQTLFGDLAVLTVIGVTYFWHKLHFAKPR
jgi:hypothetical protein